MIEVLYVDDEQDNLDVFEYNFFNQFSVNLAKSGEEGLKILAEKEIHVIVSDFKMPIMNGVEFFEKVIEINPDPIRIILTGHMDFEIIKDSVNKGKIYHFVNKPWNKSELVMIIKNAAEIYRLRKKNKELMDILVKSNNQLKSKIHKTEEKKGERSKELADFEYVTAHNLKTPLRSISTLIEWLISDYSDNIDEDVKTNILIISDKVQIMNAMIDALLEYSKAGMIEYSEQISDIDEVLEDVFKSFDEEDSRVISKKIDIPKVYIHPIHLQYLIFHLLSNSLQNRTGKDDYIRIILGGNEKKWFLKVEDNGKGVDSKYHDKIFRLFQKLEETDSNHVGIGLSIVRKIINLYNAKLDFKSEPSVGTSVTIYFDYEKFY